MDETTKSQSVNELPEEEGLIFACLLNGNGSAALKDWSDVETWSEEQGVLWVHLDRGCERVQSWLRHESDLTPVTSEAMLAEETRPRVFRGKKGAVAILRGVNLNPNAEQEDMVALRIWSDGRRVISVRHERLMTPRDILHQLVDLESGPRDAAELYERLISRLTERMANLVSSNEESLDSVEQSVGTTDLNEALKKLSAIRNTTVVVRRYLSPQRDAINSLLLDPPPWLDERSRMRLREALDQIQRYIEDLDATRDRALVIRDEITSKLSEASNRTMFALSVIAGIFLPLSFITGLLGINVGGMPGIENTHAFWMTCGLLVLVLVGEVVLFRRLKWI
jgi:zinc transporter